METNMHTSTRCRYTRPKIWVVPCEMTPIMEPSIHTRNNFWQDGGTEGLDFTNGGGGGSLPTSTRNFGFKSVWDASVTELQDGKLIVIPGDE